MKKTNCLCIVVFSMLLVTSLAFAEAQKWEIDKAHSNVYFDVRHTYATVRGQFDDFNGSLYFDQGNVAASRVDIDIRTKSINTSIPQRDKHLRSKEFFAANEYPSMTFQSTGVKHKEGNRYTLEGNLTIKGKTKKVALPLTYFGTRENPLKKGQMVAGFETRFSIDRLDYGVGTGKYFDMGVVGNRVDILIAIEALKNY